MWISYSDSEVNRFHPICERALNYALRIIGKETQYEEYEEVLVKSKAIGLSVAQYVKKYPISVDDFDSRYSYLKEQALLQPAGVPFTVMSLFDDWDTIPRGVKLSLGRNFYHLVKRETQELIQIKPAGKTSSNVQLYVKEG